MSETYDTWQAPPEQNQPEVPAPDEQALEEGVLVKPESPDENAIEESGSVESNPEPFRGPTTVIDLDDAHGEFGRNLNLEQADTIKDDSDARTAGVLDLDALAQNSQKSKEE